MYKLKLWNTTVLSKGFLFAERNNNNYRNNSKINQKLKVTNTTNLLTTAKRDFSSNRNSFYLFFNIMITIYCNRVLYKEKYLFLSIKDNVILQFN